MDITLGFGPRILGSSPDEGNEKSGIGKGSSLESWRAHLEQELKNSGFNSSDRQEIRLTKK
jgi:hypothetical protein